MHNIAGFALFKIAKHGAGAGGGAGPELRGGYTKFAVMNSARAEAEQHRESRVARARQPQLDFKRRRLEAHAATLSHAPRWKAVLTPLSPAVARLVVEPPAADRLPRVGREAAAAVMAGVPKPAVDAALALPKKRAYAHFSLVPFYEFVQLLERNFERNVNDWMLARNSTDLLKAVKAAMLEGQHMMPRFKQCCRWAHDGARVMGEGRISHFAPLALKFTIDTLFRVRTKGAAKVSKRSFAAAATCVCNFECFINHRLWLIYMFNLVIPFCNMFS